MGQKSRAKRQHRAQAPAGVSSHRSATRSFSWPILAVVLLVVIAGGTVVGKGFLSSPSPSTSSPGASMPSGSTTSSEGAALGWPVAGSSEAFASTQGKSVSLRNFRGKKLVVYFYEGFT